MDEARQEQENETRDRRGCAKRILSFLKAIYFWVKDNDGPIVAIATVVLAFITFLHMNESARLRNLTQQQMRIQIRQFDIEHFPFLELYPDQFPVVSDVRTHYWLYNKGKLPIIELRILPFYVFETEKSIFVFQPDPEASWHWKTVEERYQSTIDFDKRLEVNANIQFESHCNFENSRNEDTIKSLLVLVRFKLPYDDKYRWEVFGYNYVRAKEEPHHILKVANRYENTVLIDAFAKSENTNQKVREFLSHHDFRISGK